MTHEDSPSLLILVSHPIQYFSPVYRAIERHREVALHVLFQCRVGCDDFFDVGFGRRIRWDIPLLEGYSHSFLSSSSRTGGLKIKVVGEIITRKPDAVLVYGYNSLTNIVAILAAKWVGSRILIRGDTRLTRHHNLRGVKARFKRWLFSLADGFITIGTLNKQYYEAHGVPVGKTFFAPLSVDNAAFRLGDVDRTAARSAIRSELGLRPDAVVILLVSKLIPRKRASDVIDAFAQLSNANPAAHLVLVGTGPQQAELEQRARANAPSRVFFAGFQNQSKISAYYAASDIFVFPTSDEPWGLVLNEAMAAGLPVVTSDGAGAAPDLIADSGAGYVYPAGDLPALALALKRLVDSKELRVSMGQRALAHIAQWDASRSANAIVDAVKRVLPAAGGR